MKASKKSCTTVNLPVEDRIESVVIDESIQQFFRNLSVYIPMPDGVKIAIDIWLPETANAGDKFPVAVEFTRYWRVAEGAAPQDFVRYITQQGFAFAVVDCRGSGASFGVRRAEGSVAEVRDFAHVINWLAEQPWSNGAVVSMGRSYSANTAEVAMIDAPLALKASVPRFSDFDVYSHNSFPGGLLNNGLLKPWSESVYALDMNNTADIHPIWEDRRHLSVKPVDNDVDKALLKQAIVDHQDNVPVQKSLLSMVYRDDINFANGLDQNEDHWMMASHLAQNNPRLRQVPSYHWASFTDAGTAAGAIARFMGTDAPMRVVIGYWSHGATLDTNPYKPMGGVLSLSVEAQCFHIAKYLEGLKFSDSECPESDATNRLKERALYYYTAGEETWKKTKTWPPLGVNMQRWYLSDRASLTLDQPRSKAGKDQYNVDFEAGTGMYNRWDQLVPEVYYGDRAEADTRLLTYTSKPLSQTIEITGHPVIHLQMSSTQADGAVIVYLEEVAPDGSVIMLTEGGLRLIHRKASSETPPYPVFGPYHTFEKKDAMPMPVGQMVGLGFDLFPLSVRVKKGHALRVAIAGHDKDCFVRLPPAGEQTYVIYRNADATSYIEIPVRSIDDSLYQNEVVDPFY